MSLLLWRPVWIRDDTEPRGVERELFDPYSKDADPDPAIRELTARIDAENNARPRSWSKPAPTGSEFGMLTWAVIVLATSLGLAKGVPQVVFATFSVFAVRMATAPLQRWMKRHDAKDVTLAVISDAGRCPSCAFAIGGLPANASGRIACPECSAVWHRSRIAVRTLAPTFEPALSPPGAIDLTRPLIPDANGRMRRLANMRAAGRHNAGLKLLARDVWRATAPARWLGAAYLTAVVACLACGLILMCWGYASVSAAMTGPVSVWAAVSSAFTGAAAPDAFLIALVLAAILVFGVIRELQGNGTRASQRAACVLLTKGVCPSCLAEIPALAKPPREATVACPCCQSMWKRPA